MPLRFQAGLLFGLLTLVVVATSAQTPRDLSRQYGPVDEKGRYTVRTGILLSTRLEGGRIREMTIKPDDAIPADSSGPRLIPEAIVHEILAELVPPVRRGDHIRSIVFNAGSAELDAEEYEQVTISIIRSEAPQKGVTSAGIRFKE